MTMKSNASDGAGSDTGPSALTPQNPNASSAIDTMNDGVYITIIATRDGQVEVEESSFAELNLEYGVLVLGFAS
jgi:hypothetical protein